MIQLATSFSDRDQFAENLRYAFPSASARSPELSIIPGGRDAALRVLAQINAPRYAATRNMLSGNVTHLSPYLRHGIVTLAEVRQALLKQRQGDNVNKLLQELAWRDYYQRVYDRLGEAVWQDIEPYKTGISDYQDELPEDISSGTTGLVCMDTFVRELREIGYLHNHARMWMAAYVIHHRHVRWQTGARWFLQHLLDGDSASNNLSWQWVASTFSAKPYYFNQENLAHYSENRYCERCPLRTNNCPFAGSYETIAKRIFGNQAGNTARATPESHSFAQRLQSGKPDGQEGTIPAERPEQQVIVWVHDECLHPQSPVLIAHPQAIAIFIFDEVALEKAEWSLKRIAFLYESLLEIPQIHIYAGSPIKILSEFKRSLSQQTGQAVAFATTPAVSPHLRQQMSELEQIAPVYHYPIEAFAPVPIVRDLRRFSRYWDRAGYAVLSRATEMKKVRMPRDARNDSGRGSQFA